MGKTVKIKNTGTGEGDCFFIEIGTEEQEEKTIIMVDSRKGSIASQDEIRKEIKKHEKIDCLVVTHIDSDHIRGILKILKKTENDENEEENDDVRNRFKETVIVYNYVTRTNISYREAKEFEQLLDEREMEVISSAKTNLNRNVNSMLKIISGDMRNDFSIEKEPCFKKQAIMTLVHPDKNGIEKLHEDYEKKFENGKGTADSVLINKNSLVFLLEYGSWKGLFTGDCYLEDIEPKIASLNGMEGKKIDVVKIPHHGSEKNNKGLVKLARNYETEDFIISGTDSDKGAVKPLNALNELNEFCSQEGKTATIYTNINGLRRKWLAKLRKKEKETEDRIKFRDKDRDEYKNYDWLGDEGKK